MSEQQVANLLGGEKVIGRRITSRLGFADVIIRGLPREALEWVKEILELSDVEIAEVMCISQKTISRLRSNPKSYLSMIASDRLYRIAWLFSQAKEVFEEDRLAREWLKTPQVGLKNRIPFELMNTEAGAREVEDLLGRIEYGVLS
ncbi:MAG: DUF2384 domain-containing protein [Proteobacteria bacterium]|nr:DUF2384 domain-containing protein [Pseudomonadota bacterium]